MKRRPLSAAERRSLADLGLSRSDATRIDDALEVIALILDQLPEKMQKIAIMTMITGEMMTCVDPLDTWDKFKKVADGVLRIKVRQEAGVPPGVVPS